MRYIKTKNNAAKIALLTGACTLVVMMLCFSLVIQGVPLVKTVFQPLARLGQAMALLTCLLAVIALFVDQSKKLAVASLVLAYFLLGGALFFTRGGDPVPIGRPNPPVVTFSPKH